MDSEQEKVLSTVANANYDEFAYSGAEDEPISLDGSSYFGGAVKKAGGELITIPEKEEDQSTEDQAKVHTGIASLELDNGDSGFEYLATASRSTSMQVDLWSDRLEVLFYYAIDGGTSQVVATADIKIRERSESPWQLLSTTIPVSQGQTLKVWCQATSNDTHVDDFRVHPIDAAMTSYVYNEYDELSYVLDNNNLYTHYKYDKMGRLESTHRESFKYGVQQMSEHTIEYSKAYLYDNVK